MTAIHLADQPELREQRNLGPAAYPSPGEDAALAGMVAGGRIGPDVLAWLSPPTTRRNMQACTGAAVAGRA
ncbi:MAG: hypothetical protein ACLQFR_03885 [Streptosporangiaceae bacterium]